MERARGLNFKHQIMLTTTLVSAFCGYSRRAYAACANSGGDTYLCTGANAATQAINHNNAAVSTAAGFSVNTTAGNGITISGNGGVLSFTDNNASTIISTYNYGYGLYMNGQGGAIDMTITTGVGSSISGTYGGVFAFHNGSGDLSVTGDGSFTGGQYGIHAVNTSSTGDTFVTVNGIATGTSNHGILATSIGNSLEITTGINSNISGLNGLKALSNGTGPVSVTVNGDVIATGGIGVNAETGNYNTGLTITTGAGSSITAAQTGIRAQNYAGALSITADGDVTGTDDYGILAKNGDYGTNITITTGASSHITGGEYGISALNDGTGTISITADGAVTGTDSYGIYAKTFASAAGITITTGAGSNITGFTGISANKFGAGALSITANGIVNGTDEYGILADNNNGTDVTITTGSGSSITGYNDGIHARNLATGITSFIINGDVTGTTENGIDVNVNSTGTDLTITTGASSDISGHDYGINAFHYGSGAVSITMGGNVEGTISAGLYAFNSSHGTSATIDTGAASSITGYIDGFWVNNQGTGALSVNVDGEVTGTTRNGIIAQNSANGTDLTLTTGASSDITGDDSGIQAQNQGTGALSITANGDVTGTTTHGIYAKNYSGSTNLTVTAGALSSITGYTSGIKTYNSGTGATNITVNGDVTATDSTAINARNTATASNLTIATAATSTINAHSTAIFAYNQGSGALLITADGSFIGDGSIYARNNGTALTINVISDLTTSINNSAVQAFNFGTGAASITISGDVSSTSGVNSSGVYLNSQSSAPLTITTNAGSSISGTGQGIFAIAANVMTITINGDVTGTNDSAVSVDNGGTSHVATIIVQNGSNISGNYGISFNNNNTVAAVTLDGSSSAVSVTGTGGTAIQLGNYADMLTLEGTVAINGNVTGAGGSDTLNFGTGTVTMGTGNTFSGFETVNVTGDSRLNGDFNFTGITINNSAGSSLHINGDVTAATLTFGNNAEFGGNNTITGNLVMGSGSTLAPGNSVGTINVVGNATFNTGSTFQVEIDSGGVDRLNATGDIIIDSGATLELVPLGSFSGGSATFLSAGGTLTGTFDTIITNGVAASVVYGGSAASLSFSVLTASPVSVNTQALASLQSSTIFHDRVSQAAANNAFERKNNFWLQGVYRGNDRQTNGNYTGFDNNVYGMVGGAEVARGDSWKLGFSLADLQNNTDIHNQLGKTDGNGAFGSVYGTYTSMVSTWQAYTTLGVTGGYHNYSTSRRVSNSGIVSQARGDTHAYEAGALAEIGARKQLSADGWFVAPKVGVDYIHVFAKGYTEKTGGAAAVSIDDYDFGTLRPSVGVALYNQPGMALPGSEINVKPSFNIGAFREIAGNRSVTGAFSSATAFALELDESDSTFATIGAGLDFGLTPGATAFVSYQHSRNNTESRHNANIGLKVEF